VWVLDIKNMNKQHYKSVFENEQELLIENNYKQIKEFLCNQNQLNKKEKEEKVKFVEE
jgi:hypothetical protein